jgi:N-methylhydantoinase B/oxoprolinase/acetone carboxylase alpha subunit
MTNSLNTPLEALENYLPIRIRRYSLRNGSGGRGANRGGDGIVREYEFGIPMQVTIMSERRKFAPYGLRGGRPGAPGKNVLLSGGKRIALNSKVNLAVRAGDVLRIETPGGGGYGKPFGGGTRFAVPRGKPRGISTSRKNQEEEK